MMTDVAGASGRALGDEVIIVEADRRIRVPKNNNPKHRDYYKTWEVVEVTDELISLERVKKNGETDRVSISRTRRPSLEVGDRVRYDKIRNRLRKTLAE